MLKNSRTFCSSKIMLKDLSSALSTWIILGDSNKFKLVNHSI
jgi:hypothetical protein